MFANYTMDANDAVLDYLDGDVADIWADIESTPDDTTADKWKRKLTKIAYDYSFSSRFALMRIFCRRNGGQDAAAGFEAAVDGALCRFPNITLSHAQDLSVQEHRQYISLLLEQADRQADSHPETDRELILRAWLDEESANELSEASLPGEILADPKKLQRARRLFRKENKSRHKTLLTREEALKLGHILDFSLEEMEWFLLRVLDTEDGFRYNRSADLVEIYGFLTGASWMQVEQLKNQYAAAARNLTDRDVPEQDSGWTRTLSETLPELVVRWNYYPETRDQHFLEWMAAQAPWLDRPSRTACRIYRNLAVFAYELIFNKDCLPEETEFLSSIQDLCQDCGESDGVHRLLYTQGVISPAQCKLVADLLLLENKVQSASIQADNTKAWHILTTRADGALSTAGGMVNSSRTRVRDILAGSIQPEKGDMIYLLWFIANLIWQGSDTPDEHTLCCRILDFLDAAKEVLEAALLPEFYPPHIMEQSMLLSIVMGAQEDSSVLYEYILHSLTATREREQGSRRHTEAEKIRIVCFYLHEDHGMTLDGCARHFDIAPQTLSAWAKELKDKGIVS